MISSFFSTTVFNPLYNALVYLVGVLPGGDVGWAVVALTVLLQILFFPLKKNMAQAQAAIRALQPEVDAIKKKHAANLQMQMQEQQVLYKAAGIHHGSLLLLPLLQIPIFLGLYKVFNYGHLSTPDASLLYSFVHAPTVVSTQFLGVFEMYGRSITLAVLAGVTQYAAARLMTQAAPVSNEKSFANDFAKSMQTQVTYIFPFLIFGAAYSTSAAIALYFIVTNLASVAQEVYNKGTR